MSPITGHFAALRRSLGHLDVEGRPKVDPAVGLYVGHAASSKHLAPVGDFAGQRASLTESVKTRWMWPCNGTRRGRALELVGGLAVVVAHPAAPSAAKELATTATTTEAIGRFGIVRSGLVVSPSAPLRREELEPTPRHLRARRATTAIQASEKSPVIWLPFLANVQEDWPPQASTAGR